MDGGNEAGAVTEAGTGTGIGAGTGAESGAEAGAIGTQSFENGMKAAANESADVDMKETSHQSGGRFMEEDNKNDSDIHDYANGGNNNGSNGNSGDGVVVKEEREGMMDTVRLLARAHHLIVLSRFMRWGCRCHVLPIALKYACLLACLLTFCDG